MEGNKCCNMHNSWVNHACRHILHLKIEDQCGKIITVKFFIDTDKFSKKEVKSTCFIIFPYPQNMDMNTKT